MAPWITDLQIGTCPSTFINRDAESNLSVWYPEEHSQRLEVALPLLNRRLARAAPVGDLREFGDAAGFDLQVQVF